LDEKVESLLKNIGEKRPKLKENEYSTFIISKEYGLELKFTEECITKEQKTHCNEGNLYFNYITFYPRKKTILPFSIEKGDTYKEVEEKIGEKALYGNRYFPNMVNWELIIDDKKYSFSITFKSENLHGILNIIVTSFDEEHDNSTWAIPFVRDKI